MGLSFIPGITGEGGGGGGRVGGGGGGGGGVITDTGSVYFTIEIVTSVAKNYHFRFILHTTN